MYISNKKKSVKIMWIKYPLSGVMYCSCGKDNPFRVGESSIICENCGNKMKLDDYVENYEKKIIESF